MKTKSFVAILSMVLIMAAILVGSSQAKKPAGKLILSGEILNYDKADIYLYSWDDKKNEWVGESIKVYRSEYKYRLKTNKRYRIVFMGSTGTSKIVTISPGESGRYVEWLDIDFSLRETFARMYLKDNRYNLQTKELEFTVASID